MVKLELVGAPRLHTPDGASPLPLGKPFALLTYLSLAPGSVERSVAAQLLWPAVPRDRARSSTRQALWILKQALGDGLFASLDPLSLASGALAVDVVDFRAALAEGDLDRARRLRRGPFLEGFAVARAPAWTRWAEDIRDELDARYVGALEMHAAACLERGALSDAASAAEEGIRVAPERFTLHRTLVETLLRRADLPGAREAIFRAERLSGDTPGAAARLQELSERLATTSAAPDGPADPYGFHVELVGRSRELDTAMAALAQARRGHTRCLLLSGPPGIGKTRLATEVLRAAAGGGASVARARCYRAEGELALAVVADLVEELVDRPGAAGWTPELAEIARGRSGGGGRGAQSRDVHSTGPPPPGPLDPSASASRSSPSPRPTRATPAGPSASYADAVLDLVAAVAYEAPLVVMVDDLQWIDPQSAAVLSRVVRKLSAGGLLLIGTTRNALAARELLGDRAESCELGALTDAEVAELIQLAVTVEPEHEGKAAVARIAAVAEGNPLVVGEVLKGLADEGVIRSGEDGWRLDALRLAALHDFPTDLQGWMRARLDRLAAGPAAVGAALAAHPSAVEAARLRVAAGLGEEHFQRAVADLIGRGILEWAGARRLDFAHELLREEAGRDIAPAEPAPGRSPRIRSLAAAAIAAVALLSVALLSSARRPSSPAWTSQLAAEGQWIVTGLDGSMREVVLEAPGGPVVVPWTDPPLRVPPVPVRLRSGHRDATGRLALYGFTRDPDGAGPDAVVIREEGWEYLVASHRDDNGGVVSPDGLVVALDQEVGREPGAAYTTHVLFLDVATGMADTVYVGGRTSATSGAWSADGSRFVFPVLPDTLVTVSRTGAVESKRALGLGIDGWLAWCNEETLLTVVRVGDARVAADVGTAPVGVRFLDFGVEPSQLVCLGEAGGFVGVTGWHESRPALAVGTARDGATLPAIPLASEASGTLWLSRGGVSPAEHVRAVTGARVELRPGDERTLRAEAVDSAGSLASVAWAAADPRVASISPDGRLVANRPGRTRVAAVAGALADSVEVHVLDHDRPRLVLSERFDPTWTSRWTTFGQPPAAPLEAAPGGSPLFLRGDGKQHDGVLSAGSFDTRRGLAVAATFRLWPVNRTDQQLFKLCLGRPREADPRPEAHGSHCFEYPVEAATNLDPELGRFTASRASWAVALAGVLPSDGWVDVLVEVQPDGGSRLVVAGVERAFSEGAGPPEGRWRISLIGRSVDTRVLVQRLDVYQGLAPLDPT